MINCSWMSRRKVASSRHDGLCSTGLSGRLLHQGKARLALLGALLLTTTLSWLVACAQQPQYVAKAPVPYPEETETLFEVDKTTLPQGDVVQLEIQNLKGDYERLEAVFNKTRYPIYRQESGRYLGLIPINPLQGTGTYSLLVRTPDGTVLYEKPLVVKDAGFKSQNVTVSKSTSSLQPEPGEIEAIVAFKKAELHTRWWDRQLIAPVDDCVNSPFGNKRYYNGVFSGEYHKGIDHKSPQGRIVRAVTGGKVTIARHYRLHGGTVGINHGQGLTSIYIHLSRIDVKNGQTVQQGEPIGLVGSTGFATGPHLHWGLYVHSIPVNPVFWVPVRGC